MVGFIFWFRGDESKLLLSSCAGQERKLYLVKIFWLVGLGWVELFVFGILGDEIVVPLVERPINPLTTLYFQLREIYYACAGLCLKN